MPRNSASALTSTTPGVDATVYFADDEFLDLLTSALLRDRTFLRNYSKHLTSDDLKPRSGSPNGNDRWVAAEAALEHWRKYHEPIGREILPVFSARAKLARFDDARRKLGRRYLGGLLDRSLASPDSIGEKVTAFRSQVNKSNVLDELMEHQRLGLLDDQKWSELCRRGLLDIGSDERGDVNYFVTEQDRIDRRATRSVQRYPFLYIEPIDQMIQVLARGQLGLIYAPWKRGKSTMLQWIAQAYALQGLNSLYITLEDPLVDVEDRFDAAISGIPIKMLAEKPKTFQRKFDQYKRLVQSRVQLLDRTGGGYSVGDLEHDFLTYREQGFYPDAVFVDYDDELVAGKQNLERRHEFADIYRGLRQFGSRNDVLLWTAAQTKRDTTEVRQLTGEHLAEDISKIRKVSVALGLGKGEWGDNSIYVYVGAHKNDKQLIGCNIMADPDRMLIYDRDATMKKLRSITSQGHKKNKTKKAA